jgi:hypothetical protein
MDTTQLSSPELAAVEVHGMSRSSFLLRGTLAAVAVYGVSAATPFVGQALAATTDLDILKYALTLEYLETNFYQVKATSVGLSGQAKSYASEFGTEEAEHVSALISAIKSAGGTPVAMPKFDFPVKTQTDFLKLASVVENLGVAAYNGAGPLLKDKALLAAAGSIVQVEARHAAAINLLIGLSPVPNGAFDKPASMATVLAAATPLIAK